MAVFSARGTIKEGIMQDAKEDYRALLREHASLLGQPTEEYRSAYPQLVQPRRTPSGRLSEDAPSEYDPSGTYGK